jgi:hypothetical protein
MSLFSQGPGMDSSPRGPNDVLIMLVTIDVSFSTPK